MIRVLENKHRFIDVVSGLDFPGKMGVFIGEENVIPELESSAMVIRKTKLNENSAFVGVLGPLKMDYAFNIAALKNLP